jgi:hypothetical protein
MVAGSLPEPVGWLLFAFVFPQQICYAVKIA